MDLSHANRMCRRSRALASTAGLTDTFLMRNATSASRGISWTQPIGDRNILYAISGGEEVKMLMIAGLLLLVLIEYSMCVVSHNADKQAEEMFKKRKEQNDERSNNKTE